MQNSDTFTVSNADHDLFENLQKFSLLRKILILILSSIQMHNINQKTLSF